MNGKQVKKLRAISNQKSISWKEATTQGAKAWNNIQNRLIIDPRTINVIDGVFYQRKLHPLSVGSITKKLKRFFKTTPRTERRDVFRAFSFFMSSHPELLGIQTSKG